MNGTQSGIYSAVILFALLAFGWFYNRKVEQAGVDADGFTWLLVVIGCAVTIVGIGLLDLFLDWNAGLISLSAFAASGFFMCVGAILRYIRQRRRLRDLGIHDAA
ncbi:MAG: hypothetical protein HY867_06280 [Chloroflexi bacterium]|nr:hypothetical protein [Chloroflexota bacterium]